MAEDPAGEPDRSAVLDLETSDHVATVWLDRPEARNAMGSDFFADFPELMADLSARQEIRAVVLAARGPHFCGGIDLRSLFSSGMAGGDGDGAGGAGSTPSSAGGRAVRARGEILRVQAAVTSAARCAKPVIAAVHGSCIGAGLDLVAACDIRLASADARFSLREAKMAMVADLGSLQRLPRLIGMGHVAEMAYTGGDVDAHRAAEIGLVNRVLPDPAAVVDAARDLAAEIAANPPLAVQGTKAVLAASEGRSVEEGLDYVATWNAGALVTNDLREAVAAFLERRPAVYTGD